MSHKFKYAVSDHLPLTCVIPAPRTGVPKTAEERDGGDETAEERDGGVEAGAKSAKMSPATHEDTVAENLQNMHIKNLEG